MSRNNLLPNKPSLFPGGMGASLCVTMTTGSAAAAKTHRSFNRRPECQPITSAPFTAADIEPLVKMVTQCPIDALSTRVFQQHSEMGTCWHDAFMMILFHINPLKSTIEEHSRFLLEQLIEIGNSDLVYGGEKAVKVKYGDEEYDNIEYIDPSQKVTSISVKFKERYPTLPQSFWDMYVLALQRFLLLNYMFYKPELIAPATAPKALFLRRKSIAEENFTKLHSYFKQTTVKEPGSGLWCTAIYKLLPTITKFVKESTKNTCDIHYIGAKGITDIQAYYIWIAYTHVISMFKCNDTWFVFDNDEGVGVFSPEASAKLSNIQINKMDVANDPKDPMTMVYEFTLDDNTKVAARVDKSVDSPKKIGTDNYGPINFTSSFVIANRIKEPVNSAVAGGGAADASQAGGRRGSRKRATRRRKARKSIRCQRRTRRYYARR